MYTAGFRCASLQFWQERVGIVVDFAGFVGDAL